MKNECLLFQEQYVRICFFPIRDNEVSVFESFTLKKKSISVELDQTKLLSSCYLELLNNRQTNILIHVVCNFYLERAGMNSGIMRDTVAIVILFYQWGWMVRYQESLYTSARVFLIRTDIYCSTMLV